MKNYFFADNFKELSLVNKIKVILKNFSATEKTIFVVLLLLIAVSGYMALGDYLNKNFKTQIPKEGGKIVEGLLGSPRFINPLLATSETDKDLVSVIYSGLMRVDNNGQIVPDLADNAEISDDGLQYTFHISQKAYFHDGKPVTADDVVFTVNKAKDPELKSPKRSSWEGVLVEKVDDKTVRFTLAQAFEPFLRNTTLGILPKHIWEGVTSSEFAFSIYNSNPVGSGPYLVSKITRDSIGIPKVYELESFNKFILGTPYIDTIIFRFARSENELVEMYLDGKISNLHGISPQTAKTLEEKTNDIQSVSLPRIFGIFFNQDQANVLASSAVRRALDITAPKDKVVNQALYGFGEIIDSPLPGIFKSQESHSLEQKTLSEEQKIAEGQSILEKAGWEKNENGIYMLESKDGDKKILSFSISTSNIPELVEAANITAEAWNKIGAQIEVKIYDPSDFNQNILRQRNYDAILFGMVVGKPSDLYAFWHSSQRNDPGLNISGYANIQTDSILEKVRNEDDTNEVEEDLLKFEAEIKKDVPAIFLYSPKLIYTFSKNIKGSDFGHLVTASDRFLEIHKWFINTENILSIFKNEDS